MNDFDAFWWSVPDVPPISHSSWILSLLERSERSAFVQMPRRGVHFASYAFLTSDAKALRSDEDPFQGGGGLEGDVGCSIGERSEKLSVSRLKNGMELRKHGKVFVISSTVLTDVHNRWALQHFRFRMTCKGLEWSTCHTLFRLEMMWFKQYVQMLSNSIKFLFVFPALRLSCTAISDHMHSQTHKHLRTWEYHWHPTLYSVCFSKIEICFMHFHWQRHHTDADMAILNNLGIETESVCHNASPGTLYDEAAQKQFGTKLNTLAQLISEMPTVHWIS